MKKSIQKSVRMTEEIYNYVMKCKGEGFNEKFENMVKLAVESEEQCYIWSDKVKEAKAKYSAYTHRLTSSLPYLEKRLNEIERLLKYDF